jgi:hypothetical protein
LGFGSVTERISHFGEGSKPRHFGFGRGVANRVSDFGPQPNLEAPANSYLAGASPFLCAALAHGRSEPDSFVRSSRNTVCLRSGLAARCFAHRSSVVGAPSDAHAAWFWLCALTLAQPARVRCPTLTQRSHLWAADAPRGFVSSGNERVRRLLARCACYNRRIVRAGNVHVRFRQGSGSIRQALTARLHPHRLVCCGKVALWKGAGESSGQDWAEAGAGADRGSDAGRGSG